MVVRLSRSRLDAVDWWFGFACDVAALAVAFVDFSWVV